VEARHKYNRGRVQSVRGVVKEVPCLPVTRWSAALSARCRRWEGPCQNQGASARRREALSGRTCEIFDSPRSLRLFARSFVFIFYGREQGRLTHPRRTRQKHSASLLKRNMKR
jgi:hypothetical protein